MLENNSDYFTTQESAQRLDLIRHLIENSEVVPLVRGPSGAGKSLLAARLQQSAPENWSVCLITANAAMSPDRLLADIALCAGWGSVSGDLMTGLIARYEAMREKRRVPVLLVDDAQELPPSSLITLLRLYERQLAGEPMVSIVLFADEQIDMLLSTPQLRVMSPQSLQVIDLPPLSREDATGFMHLVLQVEGLPADLELSEVKLTKLYRETNGLPGPLRQAILDALSQAEVTATGGGLPFVKLLVAAMAVVAIGLILLFQDEINTLIQPTATEAPSQQIANKALSVEGLEREVVAVEQLETSTKVEEEDEMETPPVTAQAEEGTGDRSAEETQLPEAFTPYAESPLEVVAKPQQQPKPDAEPDGMVHTPQADKPPTEQIAHPASVALETTTAKAVLIEPQPPEAMINVVAESPIPQALPTVVEPPAEVVEPPAETPVPPIESVEPAAEAVQGDMAQTLQRDQWVLSRPGGHYTIQLLGVERPEALHEFITRHALEDQVFYVQVTRNGKPWYPLLWGEFNDKAAALDGMRRLPPDLRKSGWSRSFSSLQQLLRK